MNLIFLDTETTGLDEKARLVQLAYKSIENKETVNELFKPPILIGFDAMAVTNITNEMVEDKQFFAGSETKLKLLKLLSEGGCLVAHNAKFDIKILDNEGIVVDRHICTEKVARSVIDSENYKLQYLRYSLELYKKVDDSTVVAHNALGDITILEKLFEYLIEKMSLDSGGQEGIFEKMINISKNPSLLRKIGFGKYRNMEFKMLRQTDKGYLEWLTRQEFIAQDENLKHTVEYYLKS